MKNIVLAVLTMGFFVVLPSANASNDHGVDQGSAPHAQNDAASRSEGVVTKIDRSQGKVTIKHGPLKNLGMPAMTMTFIASDAAMLSRVEAGDAVSFAAEKRQDGLIVTRIDKKH